MKYQEDGGMIEGFYFTKFVEEESASNQTFKNKSIMKSNEDDDEDSRDSVQ